MLTPQQLDEFRRLGIVRVPGMMSPKIAAAMCVAQPFGYIPGDFMFARRQTLLGCTAQLRRDVPSATFQLLLVMLVLAHDRAVLRSV
jgi:hypothetical protein